MHSRTCRNIAVLEPLENRRLLFASIPADYTLIGTAHIQPKTATTTTVLSLTKGVTYYLRATGEATNANGGFEEDAAFKPGTTSSTTGLRTTIPPVSSTGVSTIIDGTTTASTGWGTAYQSDHVYGQSIAATGNGQLSFAFTNENTAPVSSIAISIFAPIPIVKIAQIRTDRAVGSVAINTLSSGGAFVPVNNADFDQNGVADNKQTGAVRNDGFLLPITLPAVTGATTHNHYVVSVPKSFRVWLNPDRTGVATGIGIRTKGARTVYLEARRELPRGTVADVTISETYDGTTIKQSFPVTTFALGGSITAATGQRATYSSDSSVGNFSTAVGGTLDTAGITHGKTTSYANVTWGTTPLTGYVDFRINGDFVWGLPVLVS